MERDATKKMSKFDKIDLIITITIQLISMIVGFLICFMFLSDRFELHELEDLDSYVEDYNVNDVIERIKKSQSENDGFCPLHGFSFAVFGDSKGSSSILRQIWSRIADENVMMAFCVGDLVRHGYASEFKDFLEIIDDEDTPFLSVIGNHDKGYDKVEYQYVFGKLNYYFDYQNSRFIALDTSGKGLDTDQLDWLDKRLAEVPDYHKFVFTHKPPCTIEKWAYHSFKDGADEFVAILTKHEVDGVFMGHIHAYSTELHNGVRYTVTGGAGTSLHKKLGKDSSVHHYIIVNVRNGQVSQEVVKREWLRKLVE